MGHGIPGPPSPRSSRRHLWLAIACTVGAAVAVGVNNASGSLVRGADRNQKLIAVTTAVAFLVLAVLAVREFARQLSRVVAARTGPAAGGAVRLVAMATGYVIVLFVTLGMLSVSVAKLLVGGAITGVIIGIAAQQALGNVFAGLVLLFARPFAVGDRIRIRSGSLGGIFEGVVHGIGLTYVALETPEGLVNVPNAAMLAAGVGRMLPADHPAHGQPASEGAPATDQGGAPATDQASAPATGQASAPATGQASAPATDPAGVPSTGSGGAPGGTSPMSPDARAPDG